MRDELLMRIPALKELNSCVVPNFLPDPGLVAEPTIVSELINIGSLETRKNQRYLLEIIAALRDLGKPMRLSIIGDGPDRLMLEETAKTLKINDLVTFMGFIKNASEQISSYQACIHVAKIENLPITLIEAMARGRPLFATAVGGIPEIMEGGMVGVYLPLNDAKIAARKVADAMGNADWMVAARRAARTRFLEVYDNDISAKKLADFLHSLSVASI
jgi:glycosyltransferase involved in cell wall biosynthesis